MLLFSKKNYSKIDLIVILIKIAVLIFAAVYLFGNFIPFYEGNDSYTLATIAIKISNGEYIDTNELLENTNRSEFIPGDWAKTLDGKHTFPLGPVGYHFFTAFFYFLGNNYALFYFGPICGILFLIFSERIATKLFNSNIGLLTLLFLSTSHLFYKSASHLNVDIIFSLFFVAGSYFFIKFLKDPNQTKIFIASTFFVLASLMRVNGIIVFPIEIIIFSLYFIINKKSIKKLNFRHIKLPTKKLYLIVLFMIIPWIVFFSFYFGYNQIFFDDPLTNYVIQQRGYESTDAKLSSIFLIEDKHFENLKQYSKYLLPYQFPAMEKQLFDQFNNIFGTFWLGILSLVILFSSLIIAFKTKNHRIELLVFTTLILGIIWFFASITSEDRAIYGVPGRYILPASTVFYMVLGFLIVTIFTKLNNFRNFPSVNTGKFLQISMIVLLGLFFFAAFYFTPPSELIKTNSYEIKNPILLAQDHPPNREGLTDSSVIMSVKTDRVLEYSAIPFAILPNERGFMNNNSSLLLDEIILDGYDVFIFKKATYPSEKKIISELIEQNGFILKDYSKSFCKISIHDKNYPDHLIDEKICLK